MPFDLLAPKHYINQINIYENEKNFYFIGKHYDKEKNFIFKILKENFHNNKIGTKILKDLLEEDDEEYDNKAIEELVRNLSEFKSTRLKKIEEAKCIFGFVKFYFNYYVILVLENSKIGKIGEYIINRADKMKMLPLFTVDHNNSDFLELENKYLTIFKNFEISKQTYFSFNYNLTKTLQRNFVEKVKGKVIKNYNDKKFTADSVIDSNKNDNSLINKTPNNTNISNNLQLVNNISSSTIQDLKSDNLVNNFKEGISENNLTQQNKINFKINDNKDPENINFSNLENEIKNKNIKANNFDLNNSCCQSIKKYTQNIFLWNNFHLKEFFNLLNNKIWCVYFIYGFFDQLECLIYGQRFLITVIGRRNRKYAGTRYLKRGINDEGEVANDVETEQILEEVSTSCPEKPIISSYVHIRGSVPIYWFQEQNSILPKPDIKVNYTDVFYESTTKHFMKLIERYGEPTIVCNLTKMKEENKQELLLNESYLNSVNYILEKLKEEKSKNYFLIYLRF